MKRIPVPLLVFALLFFAFSGEIQAKESYKKTLRAHTRSDEVYWPKSLHAAIIWEATLLTDPMLEAMASKNAKIYEHAADERQQVLSDLRARKGDAAWFFISFYGGDRHFNDLLNPRAGWELRLESDGRSFEPIRIEKNKRSTPLDVAYFPYLNQWSTGYYVWFPREASSGRMPMTLEVHGPEAGSKLTWK